MDKKLIMNTFYKNRFLILSCAVLIIGTVFGTSVLNFLPEEVCENLFSFVSKDSKDFFNGFLNRFSFPFMILLGLYLAGFSTIGNITSLVIIFINGTVFGFENGIEYMFLGAQYIITNIISYFTSTLYFGFMLIIMAENSVFSSKQILDCVKNRNAEEPRYKAKNNTVKFITFTVVFALFSVISTYILSFIQDFV